jgi:predicted phosphodiesterase
VLELTTVSDDAAVAFDGTTVHRYADLKPATVHQLDGLEVRTLERPGGELLCTVATTNDVHFGETECGVMEGLELGEVFRVAEGAEPYPEVMNRGAVAEITALAPAAVVVKGDLTSTGTVEEYEQFLACYEPAFGPILHHVRGNHDSYHGGTFAATPTQLVEVPGARLAIIDTSIQRSATGQVTAEQLAWLADVAADAARDGVPVLLFGHHHPWDPASVTREPGYFGINPDDSERLVDVVAAHRSIVGYFAGHTHRNRVRRFAATGDVPWVEVACVKDFPGAWAEYRVFEGGVLQVVHRIASPDALAWTELTRGMFGGLYPDYAFGSMADRCFEVRTRR